MPKAYKDPTAAAAIKRMLRDEKKRKLHNGEWLPFHFTKSYDPVQQTHH